MAAPDFADLEAVDGVRLTWNVWPNSKVEATKCVVPFAALYTPVKRLPDMPVLPYEPIRCKSCVAVLNPFARVDFIGKMWVCPFCYQRNQFPPHYAAISEQNLPAELFPQYTTIEYSLPLAAPAHPPVFLFLLDTCLIEEELGYLKTAVSQAIGLLPENALVGLITYGSLVYVHELGFGDCPKMFVFRGGKEASQQQVVDQLGLAGAGVGVGAGPGGKVGGVAGGVGGTGHGAVLPGSVARFLLPAQECEFTLSTVLDELGRDAFPVAADKRPARCTGTALTVAVGLLGACVPNTGARILSFVGGPCTEGPGVIVSRELSDPIRSHKDLDKDAAPHYNKAAKFYEGLAKQLVAQGHVLDLFASALDQVGIAEMKVAVERTGGLVALSESYGHTVFKDSLKRVFQQGDASLGLSFNGLLELHCSKDIKVQGAIGPCASLEKKGPSTSDTAISQGHTTQWKLCGLDALTTVAVLFDIATAQQPSGAPSAAASAASQQLHLQFTTSYQHPSGETRLRCTTITRSWVDGSIATADLVAGFDQEAAAVVVARLMSHKMEAEEEYDATRWLDRMLIRVCNKFGDYRKDDPASFSLSPNFSIFPQFLFNLRRSQFVQVFGSSPDETAYFRMALNRENVLNCLVMIQPTLTSYSFNAPPEPALLDVAAIAVDRILLLDAFFSVVIFHGSTIAQWRNAGYHNQPEHQAFAQLLAAPQADATAIMAERFPTPRLVDCDQNGSQARFLLAKLNPSATYNSASTVPGGEVILTDDVSLQVFMEHLQRLAVQS
ncbi:hypothetical protein CLOM_g12223 [Closterium sp. NIES-68]|nr:hypothetical protein CLOM_g12223 [Closterium sp. NIES-68]GJP70375.1 hypothetical protein CLOP_g1324 [Closterium sp. NIES-67]